MKKIVLILFLLCLMIVVSGCFIIEKNKEYYFTTDDGITYYVPSSRLFNSSSASVVQIEDKEDIFIPEYVDGHYVKVLAKSDSVIRNYNTKRITIGHEIKLYNGSFKFGDYYSIFFPNLDKITYLDYVYCNLSSIEEELTILWYLGEPTKEKAEVILKKTGREYTCDNFKPKVINIPEYVTIIEKGVFDNLKNVIIKTSYEEKPEGWEEGWNGDCEIIWGEEIDVSTTYYSGVTEEGIEYTTNFDIVHIRMFWDIGLDKQQYEIPEYIDGFDVITIMEFPRGLKYGYEKLIYPRVLIVKHSVEIIEKYISNPFFEKIIYVDYLNCVKLYGRSVVSLNGDNHDYPTIELRNSHNEHNMEMLWVKEIIILDNVTVIESGVFSGLANVVIKTSHKEKPEEWEEGWNGDCEVIWGVEFEIKENSVKEIVNK